VTAADIVALPRADVPDRGPVIGTVGSPSTTSEVTVDVAETASTGALLGDLVYLSHPVADGRHLLAMGTVSDIETRNRWHEDPNMRGVLKVHGTLPHLSAVGDTRTATVMVQAVYDADADCPPFADCPRESGGALGMSPTTGTPVRRVDDRVVDALVERHRDDVVYLGQVYRSDVLLPAFVRDFAGPGSDGAFHTGIFGRSGSGKTSFAVHLIAAQMRHRSLGVLVFDPQGQFASQAGFPFDLKGWAASLGRDVFVRSLADDLRLQADAPLLGELIPTEFFRQMTVKGQVVEPARDELIRLLQTRGGWADRPAADVLRDLLGDLIGDQRACERILATAAPRDRMIGAVTNILDDPRAFELALGHFAPMHNLFSAQNLAGGPRQNLQALLHRVFDPVPGKPAPYVVLDLAGRSGSSWLDSDETKALLIKRVSDSVRRLAEDHWRRTRELANCSVVFDEAHRFAAARPDGPNAQALSHRLEEHVRETRKFGLGWTFITQEISGLASAIYSQLRVRAYGYGLTSGSDLSRLSDEVGRGAALDLYKSFPDPNALADKAYPFMLHGPVSPLSFTSAPVFLQVFTDRAEFVERNRRAFGHTPVPPLP